MSQRVSVRERGKHLTKDSELNEEESGAVEKRERAPIHSHAHNNQMKMMNWKKETRDRLLHMIL